MKKIYFLFIFIFGLNVQGQNPDDIVYIPDVNFKAKLLQANSSNQIASSSNFVLNSSFLPSLSSYSNVDINGDGEIQFSEALAITYLSVDSSYISSLEGIESFSNLKGLSCADNLLSSLNVSNLLSLEYLNCAVNQISTLEISNLNNLKNLSCVNNLLSYISPLDNFDLIVLDLEYNQLPTLSITNMPDLRYVQLGFNQISSIILENLPVVFTINLQSNQLSFLDVSEITSLEHISAENNLLTNIILNENIRGIYITNNHFVELNLSGLIYLDEVDLSNCLNLEKLFLRNSATDGFFESLTINNCHNLRYICIDDLYISVIEDYIEYLNYNCHVNTYCSLNLGEEIHELIGYGYLNTDIDDCQNTIAIPYQKFKIYNEEDEFEFLSDEFGKYSFNLGQGTHTISPILENSSYFTVSPSEAIISIPSDENLLSQSFCITPNGILYDLEIILIPTTPFVPGFDTTFKLVYKNKGTQMQSGNIQFTFDDTLMDFVSSYPNSYAQTLHTINISYFDLMPAETRVLTIVMNINSPMETPPVNGGDDLGFYAIIFPIENDLDFRDNHSQIKVTVVNSFDPNDKTCLEGNTISPEMVGEYVHYVIRFENTGTFAAQNVVIADIIDTSKFEINTLIPQSSSHNFFTRINGNKVEFIFENINLPFDDENNDGYVAFKIKTKTNLVLGDELKNTASIYFDYNFPIITNTTSTTVTALSNQDFDFETNFTIFPNPAKDILNIKVKSEIDVKSVSIYNTLGQIIMTTIHAENGEINVSNLQSGSYFIKVFTDKGSSTAKFIKL